MHQPIRSQHLLYNITVQYNSKSYIVQCFAHALVRAVKGVTVGCFRVSKRSPVGLNVPVVSITKSPFINLILNFPPPTHLGENMPFYLHIEPKKFVHQKINASSQNVRPSDSTCPVAPNMWSHFVNPILNFPPPTNLTVTSAF